MSESNHHPKQTTLQQSWNNAKTKSFEKINIKSQNILENNGTIVLDDSDDEFMNIIGQMDDDDLLESARKLGTVVTNENELNKNACNEPISQIDQHDDRDNYDDIPQGFDITAGKLWIYPSNYPIRDYQYNIVQKALFKNTLVVLPTGLGKTFIAAVIMYNFYRWFPSGKIVFMAPTKPLVSQQIESCYNVMGIPQNDTIELTGSLTKACQRREFWNSKRIFFLTPQVLMNDLINGVLNAKNVKCIVIDEAHKALKNHAYCQVIKYLDEGNAEYRVLALSATPGSEMQAVQNVIQNLHISNIELRSEESIDIKKFLPNRTIEKIIVPLEGDIKMIKEKYVEILKSVVEKLKNAKVIYSKEISSLSRFRIISLRNEFRSNPPANLTPQQKGILEGDFAICISLFHGWDLLEYYGLRSLYKYLESIVIGEKSNGRTRFDLLRRESFIEIFEFLKSKFPNEQLPDLSTQAPAFTATQLSVPYYNSHPKLEKLEKIVLNHFKNYSDNKNIQTRAMVFSKFRESVMEITLILNRQRPLIKVMSFVGQSGANSTKSNKGITQKEQLMVMEKFKRGGYNTLVSTCVGEEGIDIGDVDLIVCFEATKNPTQLVQRMGRTGRKRSGKIVMLLTKGREENTYNDGFSSKKKIHKSLMIGSKSLQLYTDENCLFPKRLKPICHKMNLTQNEVYTTNKNLKNNCKTSRSKEKHEPKKSAFLTLEQSEYLQKNWSTNYKINIIEPRMELFGDVAPILNNDSNHYIVDAMQYSEWQMYEQEYHRFDHSLETKALAACLTFTNDNNQSQSDDDYYYENEMKKYLNMNDVFENKKTLHSFKNENFKSISNETTKNIEEIVLLDSQEDKQQESDTEFDVTPFLELPNEESDSTKVTNIEHENNDAEQISLHSGKIDVYSQSDFPKAIYFDKSSTVKTFINNLNLFDDNIFYTATCCDVKLIAHEEFINKFQNNKLMKTPDNILNKVKIKRKFDNESCCFITPKAKKRIVNISPLGSELKVLNTKSGTKKFNESIDLFDDDFTNLVDENDVTNIDSSKKIKSSTFKTQPKFSSTPFTKTEIVTENLYTVSQALRKLDFMNENNKIDKFKYDSQKEDTNSKKETKSPLNMELDFESILGIDEFIPLTPIKSKFGSQTNETRNDVQCISTNSICKRPKMKSTRTVQPKLKNLNEIDYKKTVSPLKSITRIFYSPEAKNILKKNITESEEIKILHDRGGCIPTQELSNSDEDSYAIGIRKNVRPCINSSTDDTSPYEQTFNKKNTFVSSDTDVEIQEQIRKKKKDFKYTKRRFIDDEAEVVGDCSSDEDENDYKLDKMEESFIDNKTQIITASQQLVYLDDIRSPKLGKYKLAYGINQHMDVYSQAPPSQNSDYEENSFCVGDNHISFEEDIQNENLSSGDSLNDFIDNDADVFSDESIKKRSKREKYKKKKELIKKFKMLKEIREKRKLSKK